MPYLYVTTAANDVDLANHLGEAALRIPFPWGDVIFFGVWTLNAPTKALIERKKLHDLVACITSGRHVQQLQDCRAAGFDHVILIVEAEYRPNPYTGMLQERKKRRDGSFGWDDYSIPTPQGYDSPRPVAYSRVVNYLAQLQLYNGVTVLHSLTMTETATQILELWKLFQVPPEEHSTFKSFFNRPATHVPLLGRPSFARRAFKELNHIDWKRSEVLEEHFPSVAALMKAERKDLEAVEGVGKVIAESVYKELRGDTDEH